MAYTSSVGGMFLIGAGSVPGGRVFMKLSAGERWIDVPWSAARDGCREMALGLLELGFEAQETVALAAAGTPATALLGLAAMAVRARVAALPPAASNAQLAAFLAATRATALLVQGSSEANQLLREIERFESVRHFFVGDPHFSCDDERFLPLESLRERGRQSMRDETLEERMRSADLEEPALLVFSRRTTDTLRPARLSHENLLAATEGLVGALPLAEGDVLLCAHTLAEPAAWTTGLLAPIHGRVPITFSSDERTLRDELAAVQPTVLLAPPARVQRLTAFLRREAATGGRGASVDKALRISARCRAELRARGAISPVLRVRARLAQRTLAPIVALLGGRLRRLVAWGEPLPTRDAALLDALGVDVVRAYTFAEAAGPVALGGPGTHKTGALPERVGGVELRLDTNAQLEARGPSIGRRAGVAASEWLATGDRGRALPDADRALAVLGPADEALPPAESDGEPIWPRPIERLLETDPTVRHAFVVAGPEGGVAAVLSLDPSQLAGWSRDHGMVYASDDDSVRGSPDRLLFLELQQRVNRRLAPHEQLRTMWVSGEPWTTHGGLLTAAGELNRVALGARFAEFEQVLPPPEEPEEPNT